MWVDYFLANREHHVDCDTCDAIGSKRRQYLASVKTGIEKFGEEQNLVKEVIL
jgi:hypothetical protein